MLRIALLLMLLVLALPAPAQVSSPDTVTMYAPSNTATLVGQSGTIYTTTTGSAVINRTDILSALSNGWTATNSPTFSGNITANRFVNGNTYLPITGNGITNSLFYTQSYVVGTLTGNATPFYFDATDQVNAGNNQFNFFTIQEPSGGFTFTGSRNTLLTQFTLNQSPASSDTSSKYYVSAQFNSNVNAPASTTAWAWPAFNGAGHLYGSDDNVAMTNAPNFDSVTGHELGVGFDANSGSSTRVGLSIYADPPGQGYMDDAGIKISSAGSSNAFANGIEFGGPRSDWPSNASSNLIAIAPRQFAYTQTQNVGVGIHFQPGTFATCSYDSPQFCVDGTGAAYANGLVTTSALTAETSSVASIATTTYANVTGGAYTSIPTITIAAPPSGGTQATATVATMNLSGVQYVSGGTGCSNNDVLTVTGVTGTAPTVKLTVVAGAVTAAAVNAAGSLTALSGTYGTTGGTCTVQPTLNIYFGIATITVGTPGAGYAYKPAPIVTAGYAGQAGVVSPAQLVATMNTPTLTTMKIASPVQLTPSAISAPSWTTSGLLFGNHGLTATLTDTTITGTVSVESVNALQAMTLTSSGTATVTFPATLSVSAPTCSAPLTCNEPDAIYAFGNIRSTNQIAAGNLYSAGAIQAGAPLILPSYTVATLPTCNSTTNKYAMAVVTDAATPTYNGALTGSSVNIIPVFCNGTAWSAH